MSEAGHVAGSARPAFLPALRLAHGPLPNEALKVVVCETDPAVLASVRVAVEGLDIELVECADGAWALLEVGARRADLLILPADTPLVTVSDVVATVRRISHIPIVVGVGVGQADACAGAVAAGASRLLQHPYDPVELRATLRDQLVGRALRGAALQCGSLRVDPLAYDVTLAGRVVPMSAHDLEVLIYFMRHSGRAVDALELREQLWPGGLSAQSTAISSTMLRIRTRLAEAGATGEVIRTVRGRGYRFYPPG